MSDKKETNATTSSGGSKKEKKTVEFYEQTRLQHLFYVFVGSAPVIVIVIMCFKLIYIDYAKNNFSFFEKSIFLSNVESHIFEANVSCEHSPVYFNENKAPASPTRPADYCFRYFNDFLITQNEVDVFLKVSKKVFSYARPTGGISTFDLYNGVLTSGKSISNIKNHLKDSTQTTILTAEERQTYIEVKEKILNLVKSKFNVEKLYITKPVLLTQLTTKNPTTLDDEYWHDQIDKDKNKAVKYVSIVFLNSYIKDFLGARFQFRNLDNKTLLSIQPRTARMLVYTSGAENEYHIERLLSGDYYTLKISFTTDLNHALDDQYLLI